MNVISFIPLHDSKSEHHDSQPPDHHPGKQYSKIHSKVAFRPEDDCSDSLDSVIERNAVAIQVETGHQLGRGEGSGDIDDEPFNNMIRVSNAVSFFLLHADTVTLSRKEQACFFPHHRSSSSCRRK